MIPHHNPKDRSLFHQYIQLSARLQHLRVCQERIRVLDRQLYDLFRVKNSIMIGHLHQWVVQDETARVGEIA